MNLKIMLQNFEGRGKVERESMKKAKRHEREIGVPTFKQQDSQKGKKELEERKVFKERMMANYSQLRKNKDF